MRFIFAKLLLSSLLVAFSSGLNADPLTQSNPMTDCLNGYILPQMGSNNAPDEIVNQAFLLCQPFIVRWLETYPTARRQQLDQALRQFYLNRLNTALNRSSF